MTGRENSLFDLGPVDEAFRMEGFCRIAGVDESGRGPLAGPVLAAAVIIPEQSDLPLPLDCKGFSPARRLELYEIITEQAITWHIASIDHQEIDRVNILQASFLAMAEAVAKLDPEPDLVLVDGRQAPEIPNAVRCLKGGDKNSLSIGAASILAKVERDRIMDEFHELYPRYGFSSHRGYGTKKHREAIKEYGPCPIHRRTFRGVKEYI